MQSPPRFPSFFRTLWHCLNRAMRRPEDRCRLLMGVANRPAREEIPVDLNDAHSYGQHSQVAIRGLQRIHLARSAKVPLGLLAPSRS